MISLASYKGDGIVTGCRSFIGGGGASRPHARMIDPISRNRRGKMSPRSWRSRNW